MKKIKIFLASSNELYKDREKFEREINRKSKTWRDNKISFELLFWEEQTIKMSPTRSQDEYNKKILDCDLFVLLAFTKVGQYTEEEFDLALKTFKSKEKPFIYTYFKNSNNIKVDRSLNDFKGKLNKEKYFPAEYDSFDNLWLQFNKELDLVVTKSVTPNFDKDFSVDINEIDKVERLILLGLTDKALGEMRDIFEHHSSYSKIMKLSIDFRKAEDENRRKILDSASWLEKKQKLELESINLLCKLRDEKYLKLDDTVHFSMSKEFKCFGNISTKMLPIFPYVQENPLKIENVVFDYYTDQIYNKNHHNQFYHKIENYINQKVTIYNEAKPHLLDYNIIFNEEEKEHFVELELGVCGYIDFLAINRNLDSKFTQDGNVKSIRDELIRLNVDKDPTDISNNVPKQLGISSIVLTNDNFVVFQKRQKSEIASNMFHVSIAEGLQVYSSYKNFVEMEKSNRLHCIVDKTLNAALYRALNEELGIEESDINKLELLSIYFDYELQQPIFQTSTYLNISSSKLKSYFKIYKGRDTLSEINRLDFIPNKINDILSYVYKTTQTGRWSSHAIINIISFIERYHGNEHQLLNVLNKYFSKKTEYTLGEQKYVKRIK